MGAPGRKSDARRDLAKTDTAAPDGATATNDGATARHPLLRLQAGPGNQAVRDLLGGGRPLPEAQRGEMEQRFGVAPFFSARFAPGTVCSACHPPLSNSQLATQNRNRVIDQVRVAALELMQQHRDRIVSARQALDNLPILSGDQGRGSVSSSWVAEEAARVVTDLQRLERRVGANERGLRVLAAKARRSWGFDTDWIEELRSFVLSELDDQGDRDSIDELLPVFGPDRGNFSLIVDGWADRRKTQRAELAANIAALYRVFPFFATLPPEDLLEPIDREAELAQLARPEYGTDSTPSEPSIYAGARNLPTDAGRGMPDIGSNRPGGVIASAAQPTARESMPNRIDFAWSELLANVDEATARIRSNAIDPLTLPMAVALATQRMDQSDRLVLEGLFAERKNTDDTAFLVGLALPVVMALIAVVGPAAILAVGGVEAGEIAAALLALGDAGMGAILLADQATDHFDRRALESASTSPDRSLLGVPPVSGNEKVMLIVNAVLTTAGLTGALGGIRGGLKPGPSRIPSARPPAAVEKPPVLRLTPGETAPPAFYPMRPTSEMAPTTARILAEDTEKLAIRPNPPFAKARIPPETREAAFIPPHGKGAQAGLAEARVEARGVTPSTKSAAAESEEILLAAGKTKPSSKPTPEEHLHRNIQGKDLDRDEIADEFWDAQKWATEGYHPEAVRPGSYEFKPFEPRAGAKPKPINPTIAERRAWLRDRFSQHVDQAIERLEVEGLREGQARDAAQLFVPEYDRYAELQRSGVHGDTRPARSPTRREQRLDIPPPTVEEAAVTARGSPNRYAMHRGSRIDEFVKESILKDRDLADIITAPDFVPEPDLIDTTHLEWFDVTTARDWAAHIIKYARTHGEVRSANFINAGLRR